MITEIFEGNSTDKTFHRSIQQAYGPYAQFDVDEWDMSIPYTALARLMAVVCLVAVIVVVGICSLR